MIANLEFPAKPVTMFLGIDPGKSGFEEQEGARRFLHEVKKVAQGGMK